MAYGRLSTPAPTIAVTLWNVTYHHLARRGVASPVASSTTWSTRKQHLLVNDRRLNRRHGRWNGSQPCPRTFGRADEGETMVSQIAAAHTSADTGGNAMCHGTMVYIAAARQRAMGIMTRLIFSRKRVPEFRYPHRRHKSFCRSLAFSVRMIRCRNKSRGLRSSADYQNLSCGCKDVFRILKQRRI